MRKAIAIFLMFNALHAFAQFDEKKEIFWACDGKMNERRPRNTLDVVSAFYIGKDFVEQDGTRFQICEEKKTQLRFADDCRAPKKTVGTIDLIFKRINVDETRDSFYPNTQFYGQCRVTKNPRR